MIFVIFVAIALAIGFHAVRALIQHEDKSQAISEILQLVLAVVLLGIVLFKVLPVLI